MKGQPNCPTETFPLLEGHRFHRFLKRSHVCLVLLSVGGDGGCLARANDRVPSGGSKQTPTSWGDRSCFIGSVGWEESKCDTSKQGHAPRPGEKCVWMQRCVCVCLCVLFRTDSHILAISLSVLTSACDFGAAVTYTEEDTMWRTQRNEGGPPQREAEVPKQSCTTQTVTLKN